MAAIMPTYTAITEVTPKYITNGLSLYSLAKYVNPVVVVIFL
jgi:hypothetical protein